MNWREHPLLALAGLGLIALALLVVSLRGCGCRGSRPSVAATPPPKAARGQAEKGVDGRLPGTKGLGQGAGAAAASARKANPVPEAGAATASKARRPRQRLAGKAGQNRAAQRPRQVEARRLPRRAAAPRSAVAGGRELSGSGLRRQGESRRNTAEAARRAAAVRRFRRRRWAGRRARQGGPLPVEAIVAALAAIDTPIRPPGHRAARRRRTEDVRQSRRGGCGRRLAAEPAQPRKRGRALPRGHAGRTRPAGRPQAGRHGRGADRPARSGQNVGVRPRSAFGWRTT